MSATLGMVDYNERPGTLTMRGGPMNYSRVVLNSNWYTSFYTLLSCVSRCHII